jgi:hypothetical protein
MFVVAGEVEKRGWWRWKMQAVGVLWFVVWRRRRRRRRRGVGGGILGVV